MNNKKIVFMGTPYIASLYLNSLIENNHNIIAVFTQPPRKKGRGLQVQISSVHKVANTSAIKIFTPVDLNSLDIKQSLEDLAPDLIVVMGYGLKLPNFTLKLPRMGCINIHLSLLPRWRGAAPIEHSLLNGDKKTGITIFKLVDELDAGPIIASKKIFIEDKFNKDELTKQLNIIGPNFLNLTLPSIFNDKADYIDQEINNITFAPKISSETRRLDFYKDVNIVHNKIRAFSAHPSAWFTYNNERIKIIKSEFTEDENIYSPSTIINNQFHIGCLNGKILPQIIQREGKNSMGLNDFLRGFNFEVNSQLNV